MDYGQFLVYASMAGLTPGGGGGGGGNPGTNVGPTASGGDDHTALQAFFDTIVGNPSQGGILPAGHFKISQPILIGKTTADVVTGLNFAGATRGGTIIEQTTDGQPIFKFTGEFIHTNTFENLTLTYTNPQTVEGGSVIEVDGDPGTSFYNNRFINITANEHYWFCNSTANVSWWGNLYDSMWLGQFGGGVNNIQGANGEPRNSMKNLYITGERAAQPLFNHNACTCVYDNIEINNLANGVGIIHDEGGGTHIISHMALEIAHFSANVNLFDIVNSRLFADFIYLHTMSIDEGVTVTGFNSQNGTSTAQVECLDLTYDTNDGQFIVLNSVGPTKSRFGDISGLSVGAVGSTLCDIGASGTADWVSVDRWEDQSRVQFLADADDGTTLPFDAPYHQVVQTQLSGSHVIKLPYSNPDFENQMYTGRRFRFTMAVQQTTGGAEFHIQDAFGNPVVDAHGDPSGVAIGSPSWIEVMWTRENGEVWNVIGQSLI